MLQQTIVEGKAAESLWYKDAIIYQLHVKSFADSNNDGIGDFPGLTERLDYLQDLGVTALWLLPFYPSPGKDDGYDIADYRRINPDFGTMKDFRRFMAEAKRRGLRVITELVINHTSDQHSWFKRARRSARNSDARNWYVWSDTDQKYPGTRIIFTDTEKSNWAWDPEAGAFYWHRFFSHQPDLNYDNPRVLWAMMQVMRRWLDMGVDGFRLDAIPYLCEREGTSSENLPETHAVIKAIRKEIEAYDPERVLLAEANQWPEDVSAYFGESDECHMAYHFPLMPRIYMAIAQEDRFPIADILRQTPDIPASCQWALFLRNHDELTLEMVTDAERDYLWSTYAADPRARINLGIRRRLAPPRDNDRRKNELMNSLLFSLPGTPIIYYGDEIGMGDNIYLGDRNGVRTPMQWTSDRNGGFSNCDPARLCLPMIMDPVYGYQAVNVEAQAHTLPSLLNWMKRIIAVRKSSRVFGRGSLSFVRPANRAVLGYVRQYENETILCVANLSRSAQAAELDLSAWQGRVPQEMLGRTRFPRIGANPYTVTLAPYGFFWFRLDEEAEPRADIRVIPPEVVTLVMNGGWDSLRNDRTRQALERDVLPIFLAGRRWFAHKGQTMAPVLQSTLTLDDGDLSPLLTIVGMADHEDTRYFLPLCIKWTRFDRIGPASAHVVAAVRRGSREGSLLDAGADPEFVALLLRKLHAGETAAEGDRRVEFRPTAAFAQGPQPAPHDIRTLDREQSNTTAIVDSDYVVKILRGVRAGVHPEIEIGHFLLEVGYRNTPPLLGSVELVEGDQRTALAVVHRYIENQGDAWTVSGAWLDRFVDEQRILAPDAVAESAELASYLQYVRQMGHRTAELQLALASRSDLPDFAPQPLSPADIERWTGRLLDNANRVLDQLTAAHWSLPESDRKLAGTLVNRRADILKHIQHLLPRSIEACNIRHHGDFHLGQMLVAKDDVFILDFEGEPKRSLAERRSLAPAARDVAGFIRSIDYSTSSVLDRAVHVDPDARATLGPKLGEWRERTVAGFLAAYREFMVDARLWPQDAAEAEHLLDFFLVEKAFYEIDYELANRPSWVHIPLAGLNRMLSRVGVLEP
ncbi:MAG: maltose alpha-D-glucosyltransferase / alpha-amylase [Alphaproteobacteria bacterium]|nr:maltose alpha-D-glucosyltransferase / alpha-amylase [Alphaproteobacteria bacterium]